MFRLCCRMGSDVASSKVYPTECVVRRNASSRVAQAQRPVVSGVQRASPLVRIPSNDSRITFFRHFLSLGGHVLGPLRCRSTSRSSLARPCGWRAAGKRWRPELFEPDWGDSIRGWPDLRPRRMVVESCSTTLSLRLLRLGTTDRPTSKVKSLRTANVLSPF